MKPVKLSVKENIIEQELVLRVHQAGGIAEKVTVLGTRGFFDRLVVLPGGQVVFVELKRPRGGRLSPHQILRAKLYKSLGAVVVLISSREDIDALLERFQTE
jgi:hypothetical protein